MPFPINDYTKSREMFGRATRVIPGGIYGHLGPAEGCHIPAGAFPLFSSRAEGTYFWDLDGNRFVDYMCAYGPNILGYNDPVVEEAARRQAEIENCVTAPSSLLVDFAELMVDTVASADWAFFAKNGGDTTTLAIMTARAHTHRKKIIFFKGYYHGVAPWSQKLDYPGIIDEDVANNIYLPFNDTEALAQAFADNKDQIAAVISQPYMHGNFVDNELPAEGFWAAVRKQCDEENAILIIDDVRAGFRLDIAGSDHYFGFKADMICFCKALANGHNVSALCGQDFLKNTVSGMQYTGSYWMSAVPFAAGIACINRMKALNLPAILNEKGKQLTDGLIEVATKHGYHLKASGAPSLFYLRLTDDDSLMLHQRFIAEMVKRGIYLTNHHNHFINYALSDADIKLTLAVADEAFGAL